MVHVGPLSVFDMLDVNVTNTFSLPPFSIDTPPPPSLSLNKPLSPTYLPIPYVSLTNPSSSSLSPLPSSPFP